MQIKDLIYEEYVQKKSDKLIVVFGTGGQMQEAIETLQIVGRVKAFVDNDERKQGTILEFEKYKIPVYGPDYLEQLQNEKVELLIAVRDYFSVIKQCNSIKALENIECYIYHYIKKYPSIGTDGFYYKRVVETYMEHLTYNLELRNVEEAERDIILKERKKQICEKDSNGNKLVVIPNLEIILTTRCNLKCKNCGGMMPYMPQYTVPFEQVERDVNTVLEAVDELLIADLVGGETFLYPELDKVLSLLIKSSKVRFIGIVTNGTVLPSRKVLELLSNEKVSVRISIYPVKQKIGEFKQLFDEYHVNYTILDSMSWIDYGDGTLTGASKEYVKNSYLKCNVTRTCKALENGKIYGCARVARYDSKREPVSKHDYICLSENREENRKKIRHIWAGIDYLELCERCRFSIPNMQIVPPGEQL